MEQEFLLIAALIFIVALADFTIIGLYIRRITNCMHKLAHALAKK